MYIFKNSFSSAFVYIHRAKYIFSETCFACPISEQKFTVWINNKIFKDPWLRDLAFSNSYKDYCCDHFSHYQNLVFILTKKFKRLSSTSNNPEALYLVSLHLFFFHFVIKTVSCGYYGIACSNAASTMEDSICILDWNSPRVLKT